jgi:hypothetical protein
MQRSTGMALVAACLMLLALPGSTNAASRSLLQDALSNSNGCIDSGVIPKCVCRLELYGRGGGWVAAARSDVNYELTHMHHMPRTPPTQLQVRAGRLRHQEHHGAGKVGVPALPGQLRPRGVRRRPGQHYSVR